MNRENARDAVHEALPPGWHIGPVTYLTRMGELRSQLAAVDEGANPGVPADRAVAWLRAIGETWQHADIPQAKADLLHAIYERIVVAGPRYRLRTPGPRTRRLTRWSSAAASLGTSPGCRLGTGMHPFLRSDRCAARYSR